MDAHALDTPATADWTVNGTAMSAETVADAHLRWYAQRPEMLDAALDRIAPLLALLGRPGEMSADGAT